MRNIWRIFKTDMKHLFNNSISVIIVIGLVFLPSIFTWYNVIACWDAFGNTGNLTVAVANTDEGYESDLVPLEINVGDKVVSALRANDQLNWTFTTEEDAIDGAQSGRYYAAVVIPQSFSRDMMTFYSDEVEHANIIYYANEKKNAIAPKVTDQGADQVSNQVNQVFLETLSDVALSIVSSLSKYSQDADLSGAVGTLADHVDGQFELGAAAYEKRGVAVSVPTWDAEKCIQCNQCAYVCPHATIRPFALTADEAAKAPEAAKIVDVKAGKGKGTYQFTMAISPLDCMGCGVCIGACPVNALSMVAQEGELPQQDAFDYCVAEVSEKKDMQDNTVKGSQFKQPMLEFSGSCAGCAETSYARLVTQLFGDHMYISNATGCSSIWGGPAATSPYCTNKAGHGPAWCNSLFEDNAEHGLGMFTGQNKIREDLADETRQLIAVEWARPELKAAAQAWLDTMNDGTANAEPAKAYVKALEESICTVEELAAMPQLAAHAAELKAKGALLCDCAACTLAADILSKKEYLAKKSMWIFGGDGWAYDIGYGGLDHVIASKQDVNIFVFDTEVYSNTGGQASKASNIGQVAQFAAAGKEVKKKSLSEIAMQYGYVYVAQVAMGANPAQTIKAITEAEAYHGPSLIIGYSPCEMHSIKGGMMNCQKEMKKAVDCGYWNLFRYNPDGGDKKFTLDSKAPAGGYQEFLMNEARYSRLTREFPERADVLFKRNEDEAKARYEHLLKLIDMYDK